jgi:hypothetical protein
MTSLEGITDTAAVQGLKAVEETAIATLVAIERAYEAALAQVADLATNRVRVMAPQVVAPRVVEAPRQVVGAPPAPVIEAEVALEVAPEPRVSPLVEALQALQVVEARTEVTPEPQPAPVTDVFPVVEVIERPRLVDAVWIAGRHAEAKTDQIPVQAA